jgi:tetratricopeptide (TPR) repeat protein
VPNALQSLCLADPRVRKGIFYTLLHEFEEAKEPMEKSNIALQLAFCKNIGFGTLKNPSEAETYIQKAQILVHDRSLDTYMEDATQSSRRKQELSNDLLKKLYSTGVIQPIHNAVEFRSLTEAQQTAMRGARKTEFEDMESSLGRTHPAVLNLKWTYSTILLERQRDENSHLGTIKAQCDFLKAIADDLFNDEAYGKDHIDTVMAEAYYTFSLVAFPSFDALEESIQACLQLRQRLWDVGRKNHVITTMICKQLSECLNHVLRFEEAEEYFNEAKESTQAIFGPDHPNSILLLIDEAQNYAQQGNIRGAEKTHRKCLNRLLGTVGKAKQKEPQEPHEQQEGQTLQEPEESLEPLEPLLTEKSPEFLPLQGELVELLVMGGEFEKAQEELQYAKQLLKFHKFSEKHPGYMSAHRSSMRINMGLGNYEEADRDAVKCLEIMQKYPWPPPTDIVLPDIPHPRLLPRDPNMMLVEAIRSIALVARYQKAAAAGEQTLVASLKTAADKSLAKLLCEINQCLGFNGETPRNVVDPAVFDAGSGLEGSAMYRAMEDGPSILVELLAFLGADNAREGIHYDMAIQVACKLGLGWVVAVLKEHQEVCSPVSPPTASAPDNELFKSAEDLGAWINGDWKGTYLTKGGLRKGLRWKRTLHLRQITNEEEVGEPEGSEGTKKGQPLASGTLRIEGTADDEEAGEWTIRGWASMSGEMTLNFHLTNFGTPEHAWEYAGQLHLHRRAFGGHWGLQGHKGTRVEAGGSFFFYKI